MLTLLPAQHTASVLFAKTGRAAADSRELVVNTKCSSVLLAHARAEHKKTERRTAGLMLVRSSSAIASRTRYVQTSLDGRY